MTGFFFQEGSDPLDQQQGPGLDGAPLPPAPVGPRAAMGTAQPSPFSAPPATADSISAAFRQNNPIASVMDAIANSAPSYKFDPTFNVQDMIKGTPYERDPDFLGMPNEAAARARMAQLDREKADKATLENSGLAGTVASLAAGLADPTFYLPIVGEVEGARAAGGAAQTALRLAASGAAQSAASEVTLQASQDSRSWKESAGNIGSGTLLMGLFGGALGHLAPAEYSALEKATDAARPRYARDPETGEMSAVDTTAERSPSPPANENAPAGGGLAVAGDAGAAASDARDLTPKGYGLNQVPGVKSVADNLSPNARIYSSDSVVAKRAPADLGETAIRFTQHDEGLPTSLNGAPLESIKRVQQNVLTDKAQQLLQDAWSEHYYGAGTEPSHAKLALAREGLGAPTQGDRLSYADFKEAVYDAGINGDQHPIPEVQSAAQNLRSQVLDPVKEFGQATKGSDGRPMLSAELEAPKGDVSFMPRQYVRDGLISKYNETRQRIADWLQGEQTIKAASKDKIADLQARHEALGGQLDKLDGRLDTLATRQADTGSKLDERSMEARQALPRADALEQRAGDIRGGIDELEEFISSMRGEVRDPASTQRLADLEQQVAELRKEAAPMSAAELARIEKEEVGSTLTGDLRKAAEIHLGKRNAPKEPSFTAWMAREGGIFDDRGDVVAIVGKNGAPGLVRKQRDMLGRSGTVTRSVDDWGERFFEEAPEAFPNGRPTTAEVLDIIDHAHRGNPPEWFLRNYGGAEARELNNLAADLGDTLHGVGAEPHSLREVAEALNGLRGHDPRLLQRLLDKAAAGRDLPGAEGELSAHQRGRADLRDFIKRGIADRVQQEGALSREGARASEAGVAANRTKGRLAILNERADRQQTMRDLLESARANAEEERLSVRGKMEDEIRAWKGDSSAEAIRALKARDEAERVRGLKQEAGVYEGAGARLTGADSPVDRAVKGILASDRDLSRGELEDRAGEIMDRLISSPDGRTPYDAASGGPDVGYAGGQKQQVRGSLNQRDFAMPTSLFPKGTINRDVEHVVSAHLRTMLPDIHLTARFGDVDMTDVFRRIQEEYGRKITAETSEAQARKLIAERDGVIRDLAAMRDRFRGVYGWDANPASRKLGGIVRDFQNLTALSGLGTSVINRLTDIGANAVFRYGLTNVFGDVWRPLLKALVGDPELLKVSKQQARDMGIGIDGLLGHLRQNLHDVSNTYAPGNKYSRGIAWTTDKSMLVNLHGPWTDYMKALNWNVAQAEFGRVAKRIAETGGSKADLQRMADANISPDMAARISAQYEAHHNVVSGSKFANTSAWADHAARQAFEAAMTREANINVITAGIGDKPLFFDTKLGGLVGQFKSFTAGAHEKILISNLQQRDGRVLQGALVSIAMGMLSYRLYTIAAGQDVSANPADWIKEGLQRSALTGWLSEANQTASKFSGGSVDYNRLYGATAPLTRRAGNSPLSELLGPTYSRLEGVAGVATHTLAGKASAADVHQARMALPLQNLMGFRRMLDEVEDSASGALGFKPRNRNGPQWMP